MIFERGKDVLLNGGYYCLHRGGPLKWDYVGFGETKKEAAEDVRRQEQEDWESWKTSNGRSAMNKAEREAERICQSVL